jgi:hypothetical protein
VDVTTDLPLARRTETAKNSEQTFALPLIDLARERGFSVKTALMDGGYDTEPIHSGCVDRSNPAHHAAAGDSRRQARRAQAAMLPSGRLDLRGSRLQAPRDEVAQPNRNERALALAA